MLIPKFSQKIMLKSTLKHLQSCIFNKKWWTIILEKGKIKDFEFGVNMYSSIQHFLFRIFFFGIVI